MPGPRDSTLYFAHLAPLAAAWGASYLFIEVALEELEPATLIEIRLIIATLVLAVLLVARDGAAASWRSVRQLWRPALVLGIANAALPFMLIAWGQTRIDSGVAAITVATVPIFVVLLAVKFHPSERVSGLRLVGVLLGLAGVAVLAGVAPAGGLAATVGIVAATLASLCYAGSALYIQVRLGGISPLALALVTTAGGALLLLPWAAVEAPSSAPSLKVFGAVVALAVLGTALAQAVYYRMISRFGSTRTSLIAYVVPPVALIYGTLLLDEALTLSAMLGLGLVLLGIALGSGAARRWPGSSLQPG